jgi:hypothetical protein
MNWIVFIAIAVVVMALGGLAGGWLLPQLGLAPALARMIGFGAAGAIVGLLFLRMRGSPRA